MANERLQLSIDVATTGEQKVQGLTDALNRVVSASEKSKKAISEHGEENPFHRYPEYIKNFVEDPLSSAGGVIEKHLGAMGAIGGAGLAAGVGIMAIGAASLEATRGLAELGLQTQNIALKTGLTTKEVGQFSFAARAAGSDVDIFQGAMRKLSAGLVDGGEEGKKSAKALAELGISTRTLNGELRPTGQIFEQIGAAFNGMGSAAQRNAEAVKIFGRQGIELIPTLMKLNENLAISQNLGIGLTAEESTKFAKYKEELEVIDAKWGLMKLHFQEGIAGTITLNVLGKGEALLEWIIGGAKTDHTPSGPSTFLTPSSNDSSGIKGGPPWAGWHFPKSEVPQWAYGGRNPNNDSQLTEENNLIYGNLVDPRSRLGLGSMAPGVPPEEAARQSAVQSSLDAGARGVASFQRSRLGTPEGIQSRISELEGKNADISAMLNGGGIGDTAVKEQTKAFADNTAAISSLQKQLELLDEVKALPKRIAQEITTLQSQLAAVRAKEDGGIEAITIERDAALEKLRRDHMLTPATSTLTEAIYATKRQTYLSPKAIEELKLRADEEVGRQTREQLNGAERDDKGSLGGLTPAIERGQEDFRKHQEDLRKEDESKISQVRDLGERKARIAGIGAEPGSELTVAAQQLSIRQDSLAQERKILEADSALYDMKVETTKLDKQSQDATLDYLAAVSEYQAKQKEEFRSTVGGLFDAITSHSPNAVPNFLKGQVLGIGKTITENAATQFIYPLIEKTKLIPHAGDPNSVIGKLLGGTPFGASPLDKSAALLTTAGVTLGAAAQKLLSLSASGGGGGMPSASGIQAALKAGAGSGTFNAGTFDPVTGTYSGSVSPSGDIGDGLPMASGPWGATGSIGALARPGGPLAGSIEGPLFDSSASTGARVGSGVATAGAVVGGTIAAYQGFKKGGAQGALQGVSAIAGTAATLDPEPISKAVLAGVAVVTGLVAGIIGDPHVLRENAINKAIADQTYHAPQALNVTESSSGTFADFDSHGNLRTSDFSAVPSVVQSSTWTQTHGLFGGPPTFYNVPGGQTSQFGAPVAPPPPLVINLNAIDTQSGVQFLQNNHQAVGDAAATALQQSHARLATEVQRAAAG